MEYMRTTAYWEIAGELTSKLDEVTARDVLTGAHLVGHLMSSHESEYIRLVDKIDDIVDEFDTGEPEDEEEDQE